jgi:glycosyltransferase involved in cell wall biosynthesis
MKVLMDHSSPFLLAHGGLQIQIEQTKAALERAGVEVEYLRWWDAGQRGDLIHFFGRPSADYIILAQHQGLKVVIGELLTATGSRSSGDLALQKFCTNLARKFLPAAFTSRMAWESYRLADACIALTPWEAHLMSYLFNAPAGNVHVVPNGVEEVFLNSPKVARGPWLVCTATITGRKRVLELAEAAVQAQTPVWVIGKAYADVDAYAQKFFTLAKQHPQIIRHEGSISDRARLAQIYREARGFVLLSSMESLSLSALEAAACECPLLLTDLPWARSAFGENASYCPIAAIDRTSEALRNFYDRTTNLKLPAKPHSWSEVARQLEQVYQQILHV